MLPAVPAAYPPICGIKHEAIEKYNIAIFYAIGKCINSRQIEHSFFLYFFYFNILYLKN